MGALAQGGEWRALESVAPTEHSGRLPPPADHQSEMRAADGPYRSRGYPPVATWTFRRLRALRRPAPRLNRFEPESNLIRPSSLVTRARYPAVDFHTHLGRWLTRAGDWMVPDVSGLRRLMDESNVTTLVNLDGRWGDELERNLDRYDRAHPGRFATFCHLDWQLLENSKHAGSLVDSLEASRAAGARGLKVWKNLGLNVRRKGRLLLPDDPVLDPVWMASGALKLPVVIHVADPVAFFQPVNRKNERLDELLRYPHASQAHLGLTHFRRLISSLESIVARHPDTAFVGAHVGCYSEDLSWVGTMLDRYPNFHIDLAGRVAELGRQPRATAQLVSRHPDRVLFGTDAFPLRKENLQLYFRFLESGDEYFSYSTDPVPPQGRWAIAGLALPDEQLRLVYGSNAQALISETGGNTAYLDPDSTLESPRTSNVPVDTKETI